MSESAYVPMRMCVVTREKLPKKNLVRLGIVDGNVVVDFEGNIKSRGVNIKPDIQVLRKGLEKGIIAKSLKVQITNENKEKLVVDFENIIETKFREKKVVRVLMSDIDKLK